MVLGDYLLMFFVDRRLIKRHCLINAPVYLSHNCYEKRCRKFGLISRKKRLMFINKTSKEPLLSNTHVNSTVNHSSVPPFINCILRNAVWAKLKTPLQHLGGQKKFGGSGRREGGGVFKVRAVSRPWRAAIRLSGEMGTCATNVFLLNSSRIILT